MSKGNLEKDPNKLYWDEENQVYMQYSPISDKFLGKHSLHGLFKKNGGCLKRAIENSKKSIASRYDSNYNFIYTEMGKLIEELGIKE